MYKAKRQYTGKAKVMERWAVTTDLLNELALILGSTFYSSHIGSSFNSTSSVVTKL